MVEDEEQNMVEDEVKNMVEDQNMLNDEGVSWPAPTNLCPGGGSTLHSGETGNSISLSLGHALKNCLDYGCKKSFDTYMGRSQKVLAFSLDN